MIPSQAFSCEICGIPLSKFYIEHLWMATSIYCSIWTRLCTQILIVLALMKGYNVCSILNVSYQLKSTRKFYRLLWDDITSVEEIIMRWYHICGRDELLTFKLQGINLFKAHHQKASKSNSRHYSNSVNCRLYYWFWTCFRDVLEPC